MFAHEEQHYSDYKDTGVKNYFSSSNDHREARAFATQIDHESFGNTSEKYQQAIKNQASKFGLIQPIPRIELKLIK